MGSKGPGRKCDSEREKKKVDGRKKMKRKKSESQKKKENKEVSGIRK